MPKYETKEDLERERDVADILEKRWKCECHKLDDFDRADFRMMRNGKTMGYCEIKCRKITRDQYPTIYLAHQKWRGLRRLRKPDCKVFFVVSCDDGYIGYIDIGEVTDDRVEDGGRPPRDEGNNDIEPMINVPVNAFSWFRRE